MNICLILLLYISRTTRFALIVSDINFFSFHTQTLPDSWQGKRRRTARRIGVDAEVDSDRVARRVAQPHAAVPETSTTLRLKKKRRKTSLKITIYTLRVKSPLRYMYMYITYQNHHRHPPPPPPPLQRQLFCSLQASMIIIYTIRVSPYYT